MIAVKHELYTLVNSCSYILQCGSKKDTGYKIVRYLGGDGGGEREHCYGGGLGGDYCEQAKLSTNTAEKREI